MKSEQLIKSLGNAFDEEHAKRPYGRGLIFWYDEDGAFAEDVGEITEELEDVTLIRLNEESALAVKIRLEIEDTEGKYLIYAPFAEPTDIETDWLLSTRLYSRIFRADESSLVMGELGLTASHWREFVFERIRFFQNQERRNHLKKFGIANNIPIEEFETKMLAVAVKADEAEISSVLLGLFADLKSGEGELFADESSLWREVEKFGLSDFFWESIQKKFSYKKENPSLEDLLRHLFVTDFVGSFKGKTPPPLKHFVLPHHASNFLAVWRDRTRFLDDYRYFADKLEAEFDISKILNGINPSDLAEVQTFREVERHILREIRDTALKNHSEIDFQRLLKLLVARQNLFWTQNEGEINTARINSLNAAIRLFELRQKFADGFAATSIEILFENYTTELYLFDQYYRQFYEFAAKIKETDFLKGLSDKVEDCYVNWFLPHLAESWSKFVTEENGLIKRWRINNITPQQNFYRKKIAPLLEKYAQTRVFVIISDAFRFEAATELSSELNQRFGVRKVWKSEVSPMLGVLPSYTTLGMASLLPHEHLRYSESGEDVLANDTSTKGIINRRKILKSYNGTAIHLKDLEKLKTEDGRDFVRPHRLIYIYHDEIDDTGDKAPSEHRTFSAVRNTINDIGKTIDFIVKSLDATHIFVTADHGFLFQQSKLDDFSKSILSHKPSGTLVAKKRYAVGKNLGGNDKVWHGFMNHTAGTIDEMEFWIPRGVNRFHFTGGARFVHGGAMPQEIAVPLVYVRVLHGKKTAELSKNRLVSVTLLNQNIRIVTNIHRFEFLQVEAVSEKERRLPRTLLISLRDGEKLISNEVKVVFDSQSEKLDDRRKDVQLILNSGEYDRRREYWLVLRDEITDVEFNRYPIIIDLAFSRDF